MRSTATVRTLCLLLCLMAAAPAHAAVPREVAITYEGVYVEYAPHRFALYLPEDWLVLEAGDTCFVASDAEQARRLRIEVFENDKAYTMDGMLGELERDAAYGEVRPVFYGGIPFIAYESASRDVFGAITQSGDGAMLYFFTFDPYGDAAFRDLALQIMSSLYITE